MAVTILPSARNRVEVADRPFEEGIPT